MDHRRHGRESAHEAIKEAAEAESAEVWVMAPMIATPVRSTRKPGTRPRPRATYAAVKTTTELGGSLTVFALP